jgi:hypoxia up-regulated 1
MRVFTSLVLVEIWLLALCRSVAGAGVLAVDLGSENIKMSLVKPGVPFDVLMNRDSKRKTPAVVTLRGEERWVGNDAANLVNLSLSIWCCFYRGKEGTASLMQSWPA